MVTEIKEKKFKVGWLIFWILIFFPVAIWYYLSKSDGKTWFHKHPIWTAIIVYFIFSILILVFTNTEDQSELQGADIQIEQLEMAGQAGVQEKLEDQTNEELSCKELFSGITEDCFWDLPKGFNPSHKCYYEDIGNDNSPSMTYWDLWEGREQQNFVQVQAILQLCSFYTEANPFSCDKGNLKGTKYICNENKLIKI